MNTINEAIDILTGRGSKVVLTGHRNGEKCWRVTLRGASGYFNQEALFVAAELSRNELPALVKAAQVTTKVSTYLN
jgi:hypothetical protein